MSSPERTRPQIAIALLFPLLLASSLFTLCTATSLRATAAVQPIQTHVVQGILRGGQLAQIWLGLTPETADAQIKVIAEWDRLFPAANGLNFFIFDEQQLRRLDDGRTSFSAIALAAGSPRFDLDTPDNAIGAGFNATGWAAYAIVLINESATDATFTLRVTNALISDSAGQVTAVDESTTTIQPPTAFLTTPGLITTTALYPTWTPTPPAEAKPVVIVTATAPAPLATPVTDTISVTLPVSTAVSLSTALSLSTPVTTTQSTTITVLARTGLGKAKQPALVNGTLPGAAVQQILRIKPVKAKGQILLRLLVDTPAADAGVPNALNFWVFDEAGFSQYLLGAALGTLAISAGKPVFRGTTNEQVAGFRPATLEPYSVVIYSTATQAVSYTFRVEGAQVIESFYVP